MNVRNLFLGLIILLTACSSQLEESNRKQLFDDNWQFHRGAVDGGEVFVLDDSSWRVVNLPHDWSIEDLPNTDSPFDAEAIGSYHTGYTVGGTAWYRKTFDVPADWKGNVVELLFEGVYMNADVWVNGTHVGNNIYGYTPFSFDISDKLNVGGKNVIAVQVKNEGSNSRWYTGSGIYRHVWLNLLPTVHVAENGVYVTTPTVSPRKAIVNVETEISNKSEKEASVELMTEIVDGKGKVVASGKSKQNIHSGTTYTFSQRIDVENPALWSPDTPNLYKTRTTIISGNSKDTKYTNFGIRTITMDAKDGFVINGVPMKLKGGCVHHDNGPLGAKAFDRAEERKVEILKANGYNSIRTAHNPPTTAFLDACDRLGMLVIDESFDTWNRSKTRQDYHRYFKKDWQKPLGAMVKRDRNHPSIFLWSIGNEISNPTDSATLEISRMLSSFVHTLDATRPITSGAHSLATDRSAYLNTFDVVGLNYAIWPGYDYFAKYAALNPDMVMYCSESYALDMFDAWAAVEKYPFVIGDYVWTAWDYIGEASIGWHGYSQDKGFYPWNLAYDADLDICGWKRPQSYYRDAFWNKNNIAIVVHAPIPSFEILEREKKDWSRWHFDDVLIDWNWEGMEGSNFDIEVYASAPEVELFLNGKSLGRKLVGKENKNKVRYKVPYQEGELKAIGYEENGRKTERILKSSNAAKVIKMTADRTEINANGQDLSYVTIELLDENGTLDPKAENQLHFSIDGNAEIIAVGNANPISLESYTQPQRKAWRGKCQVIIKAGYNASDITLTAKATGMKDSTIKLQAINNQ